MQMIRRKKILISSRLASSGAWLQARRYGEQQRRLGLWEEEEPITRRWHTFLCPIDLEEPLEDCQEPSEREVPTLRLVEDGLSVKKTSEAGRKITTIVW